MKYKTFEELDQNTVATFYWSCIPGEFVDKQTGEKYEHINIGGRYERINTSNLVKFTGTPREWYETLAETIKDAKERVETPKLQEGNELQLVEQSTDCCNIICSNRIHNLLSQTFYYRDPFSKVEVSFNGEIKNSTVQGAFNGNDVHISTSDSVRNTIYVVSENSGKVAKVKVLDL